MSEATTGTNGKTPPIQLTKSGTKRKFSLEFKKQAGARIRKGESLKAVADELDVNQSVLRRWSRGESLGPMGGRDSTKKKPAKKLPAKPKRKYTPVDESAGDYILLPVRVRNAIKFLKLAEDATYKLLIAKKITKIDKAHDLARLALHELEEMADQ